MGIRTDEVFNTTVCEQFFPYFQFAAMGQENSPEIAAIVKDLFPKGQRFSPEGNIFNSGIRKRAVTDTAMPLS